MAQFCDRCRRTESDIGGKQILNCAVGARHGPTWGKYRDVDLCKECANLVGETAIAALENRIPGVPTYTMRPRWYERQLIVSAMCIILGSIIGSAICAGIIHLLCR